MNEETKRLIVEAKIENLDRVLSFVEDCLSESVPQVSDRTLMQLTLAAEEIFVNIASYAYPDGGGDVELEVRSRQQAESAAEQPDPSPLPPAAKPPEPVPLTPAAEQAEPDSLAPAAKQPEPSSYEPRCLTLTFTDSGIPYNPLLKEEPDTGSLLTDDTKAGGLGIFLVKNLVDDIRYTYTDGQNHLTLRKIL